MNLEKSHSKELRHRLPAWLVAVALLVTVTASLHAHHLPPGMENVDEFEQGAAMMAGVRHPLLGLDHWMVALAIGWISAASLKSRKAVLTVAALFALGAFAGTQGVAVPGRSNEFVISIVALGAALALQKRIPCSAVVGLMSLAAVLSGNAHGIAWPISPVAGSYLVGLMATSLGLACVGFAAQRLSQMRPAIPALA